MPDMKPRRRVSGSADPDLQDMTPRGIGTPESPQPPPVEDGPKWPVLDQGQIDACKRIARTDEPGGMPVFRYESCGKTFVFRAIQGQEWHGLLARWRAQKEASTASSQDEDICRLSVIWPDKLNWSVLEAGHPAALAVLTRQHSGFPLITESGEVTGKTLKKSVLAQAAPREEVPLPSDEQLQAIRAASATGRILRVEFPDGSYYLVTPLSRDRWTEMQARMREDSNLDISAEVCMESIVWPQTPDVGTVMAGYIDQLSDMVMDESGFGVQPQVTEL